MGDRRGRSTSRNGAPTGNCSTNGNNVPPVVGNPEANRAQRLATVYFDTSDSLVLILLGLTTTSSRACSGFPCHFPLDSVIVMRFSRSRPVKNNIRASVLGRFGFRLRFWLLFRFVFLLRLPSGHRRVAIPLAALFLAAK